MLKKDNKNVLKLFIAITTTFFLMVIFHESAHFVFQMNDDLFMEQIVSGKITGNPDAHMIFVQYPLGFLISRLYMLISTIPWYGVILCLGMLATQTIILYCFLKQVSSVVELVLGEFLFILGICSFMLVHIAEIQFTVVASLLGAGSLFIFILWDVKDKLKENINEIVLICMLAFASFCLRKESFLMMMPFFALFGVKKIIQLNTKNKKRNLIWTIALMLLISIVLPIIVNNIAYSSKEWKTYLSYNSNRASIYDYTGYPRYDENIELYESFGITEKSYDMLSNRYALILESKLDENSISEIAKVASDNRKNSNIIIKLKEMTKAFIQRHINYADRPLNILTYFIYISVFILAIVDKKRDALIEVAFLIFARMGLWAILLYIDRYPLRVTQGIYLTEICVLLAIALKNKLLEVVESKAIKKIAVFICIFLFCVICIRFGLPKTRGARGESNGLYSFSLAFDEMDDYFEKNSENLYLLDVHSFGYRTKDILETDNRRPNTIFMGSWLVKTPIYEGILRDEGIENVAEALIYNPNVYAVFMKDDYTDYKYLELFYNDAYSNTNVEVVDEIETSQGITFQIVKVRSKNGDGSNEAGEELCK